jgi:hypothetical protein
MKHIRNLKLLALVLGVVVAYAAVPAFASASPVLEKAAGGVVVTGTGITGTSSNLVFTGAGPAGNLECTNSVLAGTVTENSGTFIKGNITTATFKGTEKDPESTEACKTSIKIGGNAVTATVIVNTLPICLYTKVKGSFTTTGKNCSGVTSEAEAEAKIKFTATLFEKGVTNRGTCIYETGSMIGGTTTNGTSALELNITGGGTFTKVGGTFAACPATGSLSGLFLLKETTGGGQLKIS